MADLPPEVTAALELIKNDSVLLETVSRKTGKQALRLRAANVFALTQEVIQVQERVNTWEKQARRVKSNNPDDAQLHTHTNAIIGQGMKRNLAATLQLIAALDAYVSAALPPPEEDPTP